MKLKRDTFAIVGLGLMGGSLGLALRKAYPGSRIIGISRSRAKLQYAKTKRIISEGSTDLKAAELASVIFICTPVQTISTLIKRLDLVAQAGAIVTDVGSTKGAISNWAGKQRFKNISFVGSHPLAGSHLTGAKNAKQDLYRNALIFVTPIKSTAPRAKKKVIQVWSRLGGKTLILSPEQHDAIASEVSHLPHAMACCLVRAVGPKAMKYASTGFKDTTRVAQADPELWAPLFHSNRKNLKQDLTKLKKQINLFLSALNSKSDRKLNQFITPAANRRKAISKS